MHPSGYYKKGVEQAGGEVETFILTAGDQKDFRTEALKIKESNAEAVIFTTYGYQEMAAKDFLEQNINKPLFFVLIDQSSVDAAKGALENSIAITREDRTTSHLNTNPFKVDIKVLITESGLSASKVYADFSDIGFPCQVIVKTKIQLLPR